MAKINRKTSKRVKRSNKKTSKKRRTRPNWAWMIIFGIGVILLADFGIYFKKQFSVPLNYYVRPVMSFKGENQTCGVFSPWDIKSGKDWIALSDQGHNRILLFDRQGVLKNEITEKQAGPPKFKEISCLTSDPQNHIYVIDTWNGLIRGFDLAGKPILKVDLSNKGFFGARGLTWNNGSFIVADTGSHRLVKVSSQGDIISQWGEKGNSKGMFFNPTAVVSDQKGFLYAADLDNHRVQCLDNNGSFIRAYDVGSKVYGVSLDPQGRVYATALDDNYVKVFENNGKYLGKITDINRKQEPMMDLSALTVAENGDIIACLHNNEVVILRPVPSNQVK